jgi:hypothetical protein
VFGYGGFGVLSDASQGKQERKEAQSGEQGGETSWRHAPAADQRVEHSEQLSSCSVTIARSAANARANAKIQKLAITIFARSMPRVNCRPSLGATQGSKCGCQRLRAGDFIIEFKPEKEMVGLAEGENSIRQVLDWRSKKKKGF